MGERKKHFLISNLSINSQKLLEQAYVKLGKGQKFGDADDATPHLQKLEHLEKKVKLCLGCSFRLFRGRFKFNQRFPEAASELSLDLQHLLSGSFAVRQTR